MALKSTIYKAEVSLSDMDRNVYGEHALTLALHPSETEERLMVRLLAYALNVPADDHNGRLVFAKGLSDAEEPDLWHRNHADEIVHWIEVGQPDERRLTKACAKAERVTILAYQASTPIWFAGLGGRLSRLRNLNIFQVPNEQSQALAALAARSLRWQITVQDALIWVSSGESTLELQLQTLHPAR